MTVGVRDDDGDRLAGLTVVVARDDAPDDGISAAIVARGGAVVPLRLMQIAPAADAATLDAAAARISSGACTIVAFTSRHAVAAVVGRAAAPDVDVIVAAVGPATANALHSAGWRVDVVGDAGGGALAARLVASSPILFTDVTVLVPQAADAHPAFVDALRDAGASVDVVIAYRAVAVADVATATTALAAPRPCAIVVTSPRRLEALLCLAAIPNDVAVVAIGATTAAACRAAGITVAAQASSPAPDPVCEALAVLHTHR